MTLKSMESVMTQTTKIGPTLREALPTDIPQIVGLVRAVHDEVETNIEVPLDL